MHEPEPFDVSEDPKDRNFVTALARGLEILRCFKSGEIELTNTDFAERTQLPKATVSRLTYTLVKLGYLVSDANSGTYRLGAGVLQLGFGVLSGIEIDLRAKGEMRSLRDGPNSFITSAVGERDGLDALYIAVERSREEVALTMRIGSRLPLFFSSVGRAILVGLSEEKRSEILEKAKAQDPDGHAARLASLKRALSDYRTYGYCTGYGDWRPDVNAIAVPVFPIDCTRVYGLNAGGPSFHVKRKQLEKVYGPMLRAASERLGAKSAESKS